MTGRRLPVGAEPVPGGVSFRVWAPEHRVAVVVEGQGGLPLEREAGGYHAGVHRGAQAGSLYRVQLDGGDLLPDPASRFQPQGPEGPSEVVDPAAFTWTDAAWRGVVERPILYELHVGTFTPEGTWAAAERELPALAELGVTVLELMPVAEFPGRFGWGYDGVNLFAPTRLYGRPEDLRRFVDRAHALGVAVILDVVYNHLGPVGSTLTRFSAAYRGAATDWGDGLCFDGPGAEHVRAFCTANAQAWIEEYHLDGLRFDATQDIADTSPRHILGDLVAAAREGAGGRRLLLVAENEPQDVRLVRELGLDALWNDDFHHAACVALHGRREAYYRDYLGSPQELVSAAKRGFLYQGQWYSWQKQRRGTPTRGLAGSAFVHYLENHDQVANSLRGERLHVTVGRARARAMTALLFFGPALPLLFQGQEGFTDAPFLYFADQADIAEGVRRGRKDFLRQFRSLRRREARDAVPDPTAREAFEASRLPPRRDPCALRFHRALIALRRTDPVIGSDAIDGAVLGPAALVLRLFGEQQGDRLLLLNLGADLELPVVPEPLLASPTGRWRLLLTTEAVAYGGTGAAPRAGPERWLLPGNAAAILSSAE